MTASLYFYLPPGEMDGKILSLNIPGIYGIYGIVGSFSLYLFTFFNVLDKNRNKVEISFQTGKEIHFNIFESGIIGYIYLKKYLISLYFFNKIVHHITIEVK